MKARSFLPHLFRRRFNLFHRPGIDLADRYCLDDGLGFHNDVLRQHRQHAKHRLFQRVEQVQRQFALNLLGLRQGLEHWGQNPRSGSDQRPKGGEINTILVKKLLRTIGLAQFQSGYDFFFNQMSLATSQMRLNTQ